MKETIKVPPEQLPAGRRAADKLMGYGNIIDGGLIIGGVIFTNPVLIAGGAFGLIGTRYVRDQWVRRIPRDKAPKPPEMKSDGSVRSEYPRTRQSVPQAA